MATRRPLVLRLRRLAAAVLLVVGLTLAAPSVMGWHRPVLDGQTLLRGALMPGAHPARSAIKLVSASDLANAGPRFAWATTRGGYFWVLAATGGALAVACSMGCPPATWSEEVIPDAKSAPWGSDTYGPDGSFPPGFDRLPNRALPTWWPLPLPPIWLAMTILIAATASCAVLVIGRPRRRPTPAASQVASATGPGAR